MSLKVASLGHKLFAGRGGAHLLQPLAAHLGLEPGKVALTTFTDGEFRVEINESVRGYDIFLLQSFHPPVNDHIMELLIMTDALRRASARSITAVVPYLGYTRQDARDPFVRMPITARLVADLMRTAGIDHLITIDLHSEQIEGFYHFPVDNVYGTKAIIEFLSQQPDIHKQVIVSPDSSGVKQASLVSESLGCSLAIIDKRAGKGGFQYHIIGDIHGRVCWVFDDLIDTAEKLMIASDALFAAGAVAVNACAVHPVFSANAVELIAQSRLEKVVVTDTIPLNGDMKVFDNLTVCSIAPIISKIISRVISNQPLHEHS